MQSSIHGEIDMNRRGAVTLVTTFLLGACGGGGGGGDGGSSVAGTAPVSAAGQASALAAPTTRNIALWGDSLVPPVYRALAPLYGDREVFDGGVAGETSMQIAARQEADTGHRDWITVFWYGHNNINFDFATAGEEIKRDLRDSIARLTPGNNRFLVLSVVNNAVDGPRGSGEYDAVMRLNDELRQLYPSNYFDIRSFMVAQGNPNDPQQAAEIAADVPSSSLRFDEIHFTGAGADVVARRLQQEIAARGW
jgi:lysophospholipase L1-like esterase